ncbi:MAG: hypothetical protein ACQEWU_10380 [Bacillota bacterium]
MPYLTKKQKKAFKESYLSNEVDTIINCMDNKMRLELFRTNNLNEIYDILEKSIEDIETVEDVRNGFGNVYDHIFEGIQEEEVTLCGYENKIYSFDKIKLESFIRYHYDMTLKEFLDFYTYDDAEDIEQQLNLHLL